MTNLEKYKNVFIESLSLKLDTFSEEIKYNDVAEWDSIGHMTLMSELEEEFKITLETDDIIDFSSYKKGIELLGSKYEVKF
jgi:acyl carrier protein